ncbi:MAG: exo-beta-N-acetylmuramidase NamZ family protein [Bacteroidales bacterium]
MQRPIRFYIRLLFIISCIFLTTQHLSATSPHPLNGAERMDFLIPALKGKKVGLIVNQTSIVGKNQTHLLDLLIANGVDVVTVFAPEHGFRGDADAGEQIRDGKDLKTGLPIISLYGANKKPTAAQLAPLDVIVFDIQDVGARFYTYISTMFYAMESCAENKKEIIILDRPNPNDFVDGPVLDPKFKSFVGIIPIPVLYGMTVGELAQMIKGEDWIKTDGNNLDLKVIPVTGWKHRQPYSLPVKPSPNLPNDQAIHLYASLCLFEGTNVSVGRGTPFPFQVIGYPDQRYGSFSFTPVSLPGSDKNPLQKNKRCYGLDLRKDSTTHGFDLKYFLDFYQKSDAKQDFINRPSFFDKLAGCDTLRKQILAGKSEQEIRKSWQPELEKFKQKRKKYLLYPEND